MKRSGTLLYFNKHTARFCWLWDQLVMVRAAAATPTTTALIITVALSLLSQLSSAAFITKAWQSVGESYTFPEVDYPDIQMKENVGMTFSGGGDRSYTASIGYLGAFHELGYMSRIKYMAGSSGGSWATVVYSYFQLDDIPDSVMLGKIVFPEDIQYAELPFMEEGCVRSFTNSTYILTGPFFSDWMDEVQVSSLFFTFLLFFHFSLTLAFSGCLLHSLWDPQKYSLLL
jgi:hypothetical protein